MKFIISIIVTILSVNVFFEPAFAKDQKYRNRFYDLQRQEPLGETGRFLADSASLYAWTWAWTLATQPDLRHAMAHPSFDRWGNIMSQTPVWNDGNGFVTNNIFHPLAGAFYYQYLRARNHPRWLSALGTFLQSASFEYTIEGQYTTPSAQDLVKTTSLGVALGFIMDELSRKLIRNGSKNKKIAAYAFNPFYILPWARWPDTKHDEKAVGVNFMLEF